MKKTSSIFLILNLFLSFTLFSCQTLEKLEEIYDLIFVKESHEKIVSRYEGDTAGNEIPDWVIALGSGNPEEVRKALNIPSSKMIFIVEAIGEDLDFVKTQADQLDGKNQVASSIKQLMVTTLNSEMKLNSLDEADKSKRLRMYTSSFSNLTLTGLLKENSFWIETVQLKSDVKKGKSPDDYEVNYSYFALFTMDNELYKKQVNYAIKASNDNGKNSSEIKQNLAEKLCSGIIIPEGIKFSATVYDEY